VLKEVMLANKALFHPDCLHISVAAGISTFAMGTWLGSNQVVRCMPNTPSTVGMGAAGLYAPNHITAAQRSQVEAVLRTTGLLVWVEQEHLLEAVTAVSGSGPAYFFYVMQAMADAGQAMGLSADTAQALAIATARGAAELATQSDESPEQLRQRVTSKGGATFEAIAVFEQARLNTTVAQAMDACAARAKAMGEAFGSA
jgi:pyrroline-5-carboxylate reductase